MAETPLSRSLALWAGMVGVSITYLHLYKKTQPEAKMPKPTREQLVEEAMVIAKTRFTEGMKTQVKANILEAVMTELLDKYLDVNVLPSAVHVPTFYYNCTTDDTKRSALGDSRRWLMHEDPRLPQMPAKPTLMDFFKYRFLANKMGAAHLLQSAKLAMDRGCSDNVVLACLLHDISIAGLIRNDHGHWAAQLVEPYVDPEVTWAIKHHQSLRFRPDPNYDYKYPQAYLRFFGSKYDPPQYVKEEWKYCTEHKWFDSAMQVVVNDFYAFDPSTTVDISVFEDIMNRCFRTPPEGLGFDHSPVAHMWRTIIWPNNFL